MIGTRPEAIKLAPLAHALEALGLGPSLILTGQHADLDPCHYDLDGFATVRLHCAGVPDPHAHVRLVSAAIGSQLGSADLLVVQGDTSSAAGAAQAGFAAGVPVAHVEAGLRSHDPALPWPEEEYRTAIDARAALLFAPTELAARNLRDEAVAGAIHVTGNTGIDALLSAHSRLPAQQLREGALPRLLVTCHRRENWGAPMAAIADALAVLSADGDLAVDIILPPNRHVAATLCRLLSGNPAISMHAPCGHPALLALMRDCHVMLSDSGGVQEEAPALGVPLLVLRNKTERPEALATGNMLLVGTDPERIIHEVRRLLHDDLARAAMMRPSFPYGDGHAAQRIAAHVQQWLSERAGARGAAGRDLNHHSNAC